MKQSIKRLVLFLIVFIAIPISNFAWNASGHMTGGAVAYFFLKANNPAIIDSTIKTLSHHPWFNTRWADSLESLTGEDREVRLFMLASTYPDDIKTQNAPHDAEMREWHYVDFPFVPVGENVTGEEPKSPNAEERLGLLIDDYNNNSRDLRQKAINLCWIFHVLEDIHQPLHTMSMFTSSLPDGDGGGNKTFIKKANTTSALNLHSFWDGLVPGNSSNIPAKSQALLVEFPETTLTELTQHTTLIDWMKEESFKIGVESVYVNGTIRGTQNSPKSVTATYVDNAKEIGKRRVTLAGIRLAKKLIDFYTVQP